MLQIEEKIKSVVDTVEREEMRSLSKNLVEETILRRPPHVTQCSHQWYLEFLPFVWRERSHKDDSPWSLRLNAQPEYQRLRLDIFMQALKEKFVNDSGLIAHVAAVFKYSMINAVEGKLK